MHRTFALWILPIERIDRDFSKCIIVVEHGRQRIVGDEKPFLDAGDTMNLFRSGHAIYTDRYTDRTGLDLNCAL